MASKNASIYEITRNILHVDVKFMIKFSVHVNNHHVNAVDNRKSYFKIHYAVLVGCRFSILLNSIFI